MRKTKKSACGTSFHNSTIKTTLSILFKACGTPYISENDGKGKVNFEWVKETDQGDVFTIYDWKEYRIIGEDEIIEFHIGGHSGRVTEIARLEILKRIQELGL